MRTTVSIDEDVLAAATAMARQQRRSVGDVVSELARRALHQPREGEERNGVPLLARPPGPPVVTLEMINALRDEGP